MWRVFRSHKRASMGSGLVGGVRYLVAVRKAPNVNVRPTNDANAINHPLSRGSSRSYAKCGTRTDVVVIVPLPPLRHAQTHSFEYREHGMDINLTYTRIMHPKLIPPPVHISSARKGSHVSPGCFSPSVRPPSPPPPPPPAPQRRRTYLVRLHSSLVRLIRPQFPHSPT